MSEADQSTGLSDEELRRLDAYWRATAGADSRNGASRLPAWKQAARLESLRG